MRTTTHRLGDLCLARLLSRDTPCVRRDAAVAPARGGDRERDQFLELRRECAVDHHLSLHRRVPRDHVRDALAQPPCRLGQVLWISCALSIMPPDGIDSESAPVSQSDASAGYRSSHDQRQVTALAASVAGRGRSHGEGSWVCTDADENACVTRASTSNGATVIAIEPSACAANRPPDGRPSARARCLPGPPPAGT